MASLLSIAELAWLQCFPKGGDETKVTKQEFIATAKTEYAYQLWLKSKADKREEGYYEVPSYLLSEKEIDIIDGVMDLSGLKIMRSLDMEVWLQNVGGMNCECNYMKSTVNHWQLLCDDDSIGDSKPYYVVGKKIKFPLGAHKKSLPIIYANNGELVDGDIEVDDAIGGVVRRILVDIYLGKQGREDNTNNSNGDT